MTKIESIGFGVVLFLVTVMMGLIALPFIFALVWAAIAGIVFRPLQVRMTMRTGGQEGKAALLSLLVIVTAVILPLTFLASMFIDQAASLYFDIQTREVDFGYYFAAIHEGLPERIQQIVDSSGYGDLERVKDRGEEILRSSLGLIASYALSLGGNALSFVLSFGVGLYATYFFLRDGERLAEALCSATPLPKEMAHALCLRISSIVKATVKGSVVVGLVQGGLGAITFWAVGVPSAVLLGVVMALASLLPAIGPAIVWAPVAVWLFVSGDIWDAIAVTISGVVVIGMIDNVLRPILVGKDTQIPDWVVLVSTLGGIASFGLSGIVIGPVVAGVFMTCWSVSREMRSERVPGDHQGEDDCRTAS